jgi:hypothetical protein
MKSLSSTSFFRVFDLLVGETTPGQKSDGWQVDDVRFERERHSFSGRTHCFAIDVFTISHPGRRSWGLTVVKEYWWEGGHKRSIKTQNWSRPINGSRRDIIAWFRAHEDAFQR